MRSKNMSNTPPNGPSKTGNPSGGGRGNNPPRSKWAFVTVQAKKTNLRIYIQIILEHKNKLTILLK
jgi:hypothetical protein